MPQELKEQIPKIHELLECLKIQVLVQPGIEADDIIASLCSSAEREGYRSVIVSKDKDFMQLVSENVQMADIGKINDPLKFIDRQKVIDLMGVKPEQIIDLLALAGDSADNIPGVTKIGPKNAAKLLIEYETLENLYLSVDKLKKGKLKENLINDREKAELSRKLAELKRDIPLNRDIHEFEIKQPDIPRYREFLKKMDFYSVLKEIDTGQGAPSREDVKYRLIRDISEVSRIAGEIEKNEWFCFDTETTGLSPIDDNIAGISICYNKGEAYYIPLMHDEFKLPRDKVVNILKPLFESPKIGLIGQNIKFDIMVLRKIGIKPQNIIFDTLVASYLLNPSSRGHKLEDQALERLNTRMAPISDLIGKGKSQISFSAVPVEKACDYACEDADITLRLKFHLQKELEEKGLMDLFMNIELKLIPVLTEMELNGVTIDTVCLKELSNEFNKRIEILRSDIYKAAGQEFNINSFKQLGEILFTKLGYTPINKTKTGFSTNVEVLSELAKVHEFPSLILSYRHYVKLVSTYIDALPQLISPETGKVHSSFNQTITGTGRLSSSNPNFQNIPIKTEDGKEIRRAFIPSSSDRLIVSADYSQIELRILAHIAEEEILKEAFRNGRDIHNETASLIFGVAAESVGSEQRGTAKTVNFGVIYGQTAFGLSKQLGIPVKEANKFIQDYFIHYPGINKYMEETVEFAETHGYVETIEGRRRYIPDIQSTNQQLRKFAERVAVNTPIQGS
ncbi:MAG: DNA polymerase I, partial [bacterium]